MTDHDRITADTIAAIVKVRYDPTVSNEMLRIAITAMLGLARVQGTIDATEAMRAAITAQSAIAKAAA